MTNDIKTEIAELERLTKEYEKLTKKRAPLFNITDLRNAQSAVEAMSDALEEAKDRAASLSEGFKGQYALNVANTSELKKGYDAISLATKAQSKLTDISQKLKYDQQEIYKLNKKQLLAVQDKQKAAFQDLKEQSERLAKEKIGVKFSGQINEATVERLRFLGKINEQEESILRAAADGFQVIKDTDYLLTQRIQKEERIEELMGLGGIALKGIEQSLNKIGLGGLASALGVDSALEKMRELAEEIEKASGATLSFADKIKVLKAGFEEVKDQLAESLTDPLAIGTFLATQITDAFLSLDKSTGELAKNFGISYRAASGLSNDLNSAANNSYLLNVTTQGLTEAFITLNNQFGTFAQISDEALTTFTRLTKEAGLSAESAGMLFRTTVLTGKEVEGTTKEFLGEAVALASANGIALNQKQILEEVKNTSQATLLSLGGQPAKIAEAIVQAKLLGVNLQQVEGIASSLLQFESSISAELEAELLTGKNLNLERARLAAINNDLATVAEEIAKQVGTAAEFTARNVIQQEALAKSVGLTREDLAKSLIEREALVKLSGVEGKTAQERFNNLVKEVGLEEAKKRLGDETLANQLAGQSVQERFTASIEKLKEVFVSLVEPLMPVLDVFAEIAGVVSALVAGPMGQILKFAATLAKYLLPVYGLYKGILVLQSANVAVSRVAAIIEAGRLTTLQGQVVARGEENAISKITVFFARLRLLFARQELGTQVLTTAQKSAQLGLGGQILVMLGLQNAAEMYKLTLMTGGTTQAAIRAGLEETILGSLILQAGAILSNIGKSTIELGIKMGIASATLATNAALTFGVGVAVAVAAAIAGYAAIKSLTADDMVSPQGYGKRTLLAPEGAIQLNDKDTVIAGTDLGGGTQQSSGQSSGGGSVNMAPLVAELQAIKTLLNTVLNKEGTISINGTTVATAIYPDIQRMSRLKDFKTQ
jgi:hypothetical protein